MSEQWDARCVFALVNALTTDTGDAEAVMEWVGEHVTITDPSSWQYFALTLAGIARRAIVGAPVVEVL